MIIKNNLNLVSKSNNGLLDKKHKKNNTQKVNFGAQVKLRDDYFNKFRNNFVIKYFDKVTGFFAAVASVVGFFVGGLALMIDYYVKKTQGKIKSGDKKLKEKKSPSPANQAGQTESKVQTGPAEVKIHTESTASEKVNTQTSPIANSEGTTVNKYSFLQKLKDEAKQNYESVSSKGSVSFGKQERTEKKQSHESEFAHFEPVTEFGKMGLGLAKAALVVSGFAGFFAGTALHVPLMSLGEVVANLLAAPLINTGLGYAIMSLGLALLFLGRGYDGDPLHRANYSIMSTKGWLGGGKYIADNIMGCLKDTVDSTKVFGKHIANLFSSNKQAREEAKHFFGTKVLRIKSSTAIFGQEINAAGQTTVTRGLKSYPYRFQVAAAVLTLGGLGVVTADILRALGITKNDKLKKATFRIAETGQVLDNLGLVAYGRERCLKGNKVAGYPTIMSGFTMMLGAPNADNDFGKGLTWFGLSFFFLFLAIERLGELCMAFKERRGLKAGGANRMIEEARAIAKQFEIDLSRFLPKEYLDYFRQLIGESQESTFVTISKIFASDSKPNSRFTKCVENHKKALTKATANAIKAFEEAKDKRLTRIPEFLKYIEDLLKNPYDPKFTEKELIETIIASGRNFPEEYYANIICKQGNAKEIIISNICDNAKNSGWKNYKDTIIKLCSDTEQYIKDAAQYVLDNAEKLLGKKYAQS